MSTGFAAALPGVMDTLALASCCVCNGGPLCPRVTGVLTVAAGGLDSALHHRNSQPELSIGYRR
ncbi:MAG TPA: hypothetical protein VN682_25930 [Terriglobales bacterium]|nr:hypothetical protein [Terriglobales bacterium]